MEPHKIVSHDEWIAARKAYLAEEKAFSKARDTLSKKRRELPWEKVEKNYVFDTPNGKQSLADLFGGKSQLIVYHFMLGPGWEAGCPSCSLIADHFDGAVDSFGATRHRLRRRLARAAAGDREVQGAHGLEIQMGVVVRQRFQCRLSGLGVARGEGRRQGHVQLRTDHVPERRAARRQRVLQRSTAGEVFHTYSTYGRGLDILIGAYNLIDLAPKGRDEDGLKYGMAWVRHHDRYEGAVVDTKASYQQPKSASCCD